jgi:GT2 family glycosyltransferase
VTADRGASPSGRTDPWQRVSAVVVAYNSEAVIRSCLESISRAREVIVVDNASTDETLETVGAAASNAAIVKVSENIGFGAAANEGLQRAAGEFVLLINPDAVLEPGALERLVAAADDYPRAAMLAPALMNAQGEIKRSHDASLIERESMPRKRSDPAPEGDVCAAFISGAVLLLRKSALDEVGLFDRAIFLYYEDDDLCLRLRERGWSLVLVAGAKARHLGGASSAWSWELHWRKFWHMGWSRLYFERKHRGDAAARREAARALARYAGKILADFGRSDRVKMWRDMARFCGTAGFLLGLDSR